MCVVVTSRSSQLNIALGLEDSKKVSIHIHVPVYKNLLNVVLAMPWHARVAPTHVLILLRIAPLMQIDHLHL